MNVIVDTCVWSLALRKSKKQRLSAEQQNYVNELKELITEVRVQFVGAIRQELLCGIKSNIQFTQLKHHLHSFDDLPVKQIDYEMAAEFFNKARSQGIQGSNTDFLLCAISYRLDIPIFTLDKDFINFRSIFSVRLHLPRNS